MTKPLVKFISARELQKMFNQGGYWEQTKTGILQAKVMTDRHPSSPVTNEPTCTRSQYIIYINTNGKKIAGVHQYLRPNGQLGASGRPDPKELLVNGIWYRTK